MRLTKKLNPKILHSSHVCWSTIIVLILFSKSTTTDRQLVWVHDNPNVAEAGHPDATDLTRDFSRRNSDAMDILALRLGLGTGAVRGGIRGSVPPF